MRETEETPDPSWFPTKRCTTTTNTYNFWFFFANSLSSKVTGMNWYDGCMNGKLTCTIPIFSLIFFSMPIRYLFDISVFSSYSQTAYECTIHAYKKGNTDDRVGMSNVCNAYMHACHAFADASDAFSLSVSHFYYCLYSYDSFDHTSTHSLTIHLHCIAIIGVSWSTENFSSFRVTRRQSMMILVARKTFVNHLPCLQQSWGGEPDYQFILNINKSYCWYSEQRVISCDLWAESFQHFSGASKLNDPNASRLFLRLG